MALINCTECNHQVSDQAEFCPNCGYSQHIKRVTVSNPYKGKLKILVGAFLFSGGILLLLISSFNNMLNLLTASIFISIVGFITIIIGKIQHWWNWK